MTRVLLDANALMMPVEVGVRIFDELDRLLGGPSPAAATGPTPGPAIRPRGAPVSVGSDADTTGGGDGSDTEATDIDSRIDGVTLVVPQAVIDELDRLSSGRGKEATAASVGADLARDRCGVLAHESEYADDAICELAIGFRARIDYVLTNDRELRERLGVHDVPVICLRGHTQLTIQNP